MTVRMGATRRRRHVLVDEVALVPNEERERGVDLALVERAALEMIVEHRHELGGVEELLGPRGR